MSPEWRWSFSTRAGTSCIWRWFRRKKILPWNPCRRLIGHAIFALAGLGLLGFFTVFEPEWMPLAWSDSRAAWLGAVAGHPDTSERIEAAAYRGKPIYFDVIYPWSKPERSAPSIPTPHERIANIIGVTLFFALALSGRSS